MFHTYVVIKLFVSNSMLFMLSTVNVEACTGTRKRNPRTKRNVSNATINLRCMAEKSEKSVDAEKSVKKKRLEKPKRKKYWRVNGRNTSTCIIQSQKAIKTTKKKKMARKIETSSINYACATLVVSQSNRRLFTPRDLSSPWDRPKNCTPNRSWNRVVWTGLNI